MIIRNNRYIGQKINVNAMKTCLKVTVKYFCKAQGEIMILDIDGHSRKRHIPLISTYIVYIKIKMKLLHFHNAKGP